MLELQLSNHDLVLASPEPLTHKTLQRARKGRRLTPHMRRRVTIALNVAAKQKAAGDAQRGEWSEPELFNYGKDRASRDPGASSS
jgi:hypothetical protein